MADTIGSLAYRVKFDASQLTQGLLSTRQQMSAARKMTESLASPLEKYINGLTNLNAVIQRNTDLEKHRVTFENQLERAYLQEAAAIRVLTKDELARLSALKLADKSRSGGGSAGGGSKVDHAAIYRQENIARGQADQERYHRYTTMVDKESEAAQRGLQERLKIYKREKAEREKLLKEQTAAVQRAAAEEKAIWNASIRSGVSRNRNRESAGVLPGGIGSMRGTLSAIGAAAGVGSLISIGRDAVVMSADVDRAGASMEAFTGSSAKAAAMLSEIRNLSSLAGIGFRALSERAAVLMGYGVTAEETSKKLRQFAEISRGDTERFKSLALAFGQVNAAGRLMGQEVLQMVNAGFNPLQEIARTTGIEFSTLKKMMENGQVSIDMVSRAFETATEAGGRFDGMMEKIAETSAGSLGRMSSEWEIFLDKLGKSMPIKGAAKEITEGLKTSSTYLSEQQDAIQRRMDYAKQSGNATVPDALAGGGLRNAAIISNELEARVKNSNYNQQARDFEKQQAEADKKKKLAEEERQKVVAMNAVSMEKAREAKFEALKGSLPEIELKRLERYLSLVDDVTKKQMQLNFVKNKNISLVAGMLDKSVLEEVRQAEAYDKAKPTRKPKSEKDAERRSELLANLKDEGQKITEKLRSGLDDKQYNFAEKVGRLRMLVNQGALNPQVAMQERMQMAMKEVSYNPHSGAASMQQGSQEAYKQLISGQVRNENKLLKEQQAMHLIAKTALAAQQEQVRLQQELNAKLDFESVGG